MLPIYKLLPEKQKYQQQQQQKKNLYHKIGM